MDTDIYMYVDGTLLLEMKDTDDVCLSLFESKDIQYLNSKAAKKFIADNKLGNREADDHDEDYPLIVSSKPVKQLRDQLHAMGYGKHGIGTLFDFFKKGLEDKYKSDVDLNLKYTSEDTEVRNQEIKQKQDYIEELNFEDWYSIATGRKQATGISALACDDLLEVYPDLFVHLSILTDNVASEKVIVFDLTSVTEYADDVEHAINEYSANSTKPIIITEGRTDSEFLENSISVLFPHISRYVRFLETDFKPEMNSSAILKMASSFAAAGIRENMLFILDNDSAGTSAIKSFSAKAKALPNNYRISQYPDIDILKKYPTIGPQGLGDLDVNGTAGSIELYLGTDVLKDDKGQFLPVHWKSYMEDTKSYQGVVLEKNQIQEDFRKKYKSAKSASSPLDMSVWNEMTILIEHILDELSKLPPRYPMREMEDFYS